MSQRTQAHHLQVSNDLYAFVNNEVLPGTHINKDTFWKTFSDLVFELAPKNQSLLNERERLQHELDQWHLKHPGPIKNAKAYKDFLQKIGYLVPVPKKVKIATSKVDKELAQQAGPQLVVPILNARYALNATNARWGSLYDALYGTDVISELDGCEKTAAYNPKRGAKVIDYARHVLDRVVPLKKGSHLDSVKYEIVNGALKVTLSSGVSSALSKPSQCLGYQGEKAHPSSIVFEHHGLHLDLLIDRSTTIGSKDPAGVSDLVIESALSTILDLEDSVAAVDSQDKVLAYRNWLGIVKGTLSESVSKNGVTFTRSLNPDRSYKSLKGTTISLPGRSLLFLRNVGHLMSNPAILFQDPKTSEQREIPEGILDAFITTAIAIHDLNAKPTGIKNSRKGSVYIVKPKMHGPKEVAFADLLFTKVEKALQLKKNTVKLGIMDEERRTSVNLKACIASAPSRVAFINTGFLDRTGDEMHTSMLAGPMMRKGDMKSSAWIQAYEKNNVLVGLSCGLRGKAQIGKGMWAMPDLMADMLKQKIAHPLAGANTAWVPSPTAATLHALHYHQVDVFSVQKQIEKSRTNPSHDQLLSDLLSVPVVSKPNWTPSQIQEELNNNAQGILGYVVRWVDQGVGCSKVPDIHNIGLMEDRATLRISSQHIANWLHHGIVTSRQVQSAFKKMAAVVDAQNKTDPHYVSMADKLENSKAYQAALDLVFKGKEQPSGYTEPLLHAWRTKVKASSH